MVLTIPLQPVKSGIAFGDAFICRFATPSFFTIHFSLFIIKGSAQQFRQSRA